MHARGGLFSDAVNAVQHLWILVVHHAGQVAAIVQNHVGIPWLAVLQNGLFHAPVALFHGLALPGVHRDALGSDVGGGVILCGENIAGGPAHFRAQLYQGFDQHGRLNGHVDAAQNLGAGQWLAGLVACAQGHQRGHFRLGENDFLATELGQGYIGDLVIVLAHE